MWCAQVVVMVVNAVSKDLVMLVEEAT